MALDEPSDTDETVEIKGHTFVVDKDFIAQAKPITIDFNGMGFVLDSSLDLGAAGGCDSCSSCG